MHGVPLLGVLVGFQSQVFLQCKLPVRDTWPVLFWWGIKAGVCLCFPGFCVFSMAYPVLKDKHSLVGKDVLPLVRKLRNHDGKVNSWARHSGKDVSTLTAGECDALFMDLTGQNSEEMLEMAAKPLDEASKPLAVHVAIVDANFLGQPQVVKL